MTEMIDLFGSTFTDFQTAVQGNPYIAICAILGLAGVFYIFVAVKSILSRSRDNDLEAIEPVQKEVPNAQSDIS